MKKTILLLGFICFLSTLHSQVLVAHYPFNGNANDASGNGHDGTVNGALLATDRFGNANSAYSFDGVDDFIEAVADNLPTGDRTVSIWFNADAGSISTRPGLFGYGGGSCGGSFFMSINNTPGATNHYQTQGHCNINQVMYQYPVVPENRWYNWVITISGNTIVMYINGQKVVTGAGSFTVLTNVTGTKVSIGAIPGPSGSANYVDGNVSRFKGKLDEIKIYSGVMNDLQVIDEYQKACHDAGSGNARNFLGFGEHLEISTTGYTGINTYTIECWYKPTSIDNGVVWENYSISTPGLINISHTDGSLDYHVGGSASINTGPLIVNRWYHIACIYDGVANIQSLYVDGVLKGINVVDVPDLIGPTILYMWRGFPTFFYNEGELDEIRIWDIALSSTEIKTRMCTRIKPNDPLYGNLKGYYNFDIDDASIIRDLKGVNDAILDGSLFKKSGASIGDASSYDYSVTPSATLSHPQGENIQITATSGSPAGIQLYRVDESPNHINGAPGIGSNNRYFGVHVIEGANPQYTITYDYTGNPFVTTSNENSLTLYKRDHNGSPTWADANPVLNTISNTLVATGQSTEFILGLTSGVLPISYQSFSAFKKGSTVRLEWETASELNNSGFEILRSTDGFEYVSIGWVQGSGNTNSVRSYSFSDTRPSGGKNYYRLKQKDADGKTKLSEVRLVNFALSIHVIVFPNPATDVLYIALGDKNIVQVEILNSAGQKIWDKQNGFSSNLSVPLDHLANGVYILRVTNDRKEQITQNFIKR